MSQISQNKSNYMSTKTFKGDFIGIGMEKQSIIDTKGLRIVVGYICNQNHRNTLQYMGDSTSTKHYPILPFEVMSESSEEHYNELSTLPELIDVDDDLDVNVEDHLQLAIDTISKSPLDHNGQPTLKIHAAACLFNVKHGTLTS